MKTKTTQKVTTKTEKVVTAPKAVNQTATTDNATPDATTVAKGSDTATTDATTVNDDATTVNETQRTQPLTLEDVNTVRLESNLNPCAQHLAGLLRKMIPQPTHVDAYLIERLLNGSVPDSEWIEGQYSFLMGMDVDILDEQGEWTGETVFQKLRVYFPACTVATLDKLFIQSTHNKKNAKTGKVDTVKRNGALARVLIARNKDLTVESTKVGNKTHKYIKYLPEFTIDDLRGAKVSRLDATLKILLGTLFTCDVRTTGDLFDTVSTDGDFTILKNGDLTVVTVRKGTVVKYGGLLAPIEARNNRVNAQSLADFAIATGIIPQKDDETLEKAHSRIRKEIRDSGFPACSWVETAPSVGNFKPVMFTKEGIEGITAYLTSIKTIEAEAAEAEAS